MVVSNVTDHGPHSSDVTLSKIQSLLNTISSKPPTSTIVVPPVSTPTNQVEQQQQAHPSTAATTTTSIHQAEHSNPFVSKQFKSRVATFTAKNWYHKPFAVRPLVCARYGYACIDTDMIQCVDCGVMHCFPTTITTTTTTTTTTTINSTAALLFKNKDKDKSRSTSNIYSLFVEQWLQKIKTSHGVSCAYHSQASPIQMILFNHHVFSSISSSSSLLVMGGSSRRCSGGGSDENDDHEMLMSNHRMLRAKFSNRLHQMLPVISSYCGNRDADDSMVMIRLNEEKWRTVLDMDQYGDDVESFWNSEQYHHRLKQQQQQQQQTQDGASNLLLSLNRTLFEKCFWIALFGWKVKLMCSGAQCHHASTTKTTTHCFYCEYCQVRVPIIVGTNNQQQQQQRYMEMDPLNNHRFWCPCIHGSPPMRDQSIISNNNNSNSGNNMVDIHIPEQPPGWKQVLDAIQSTRHMVSSGDGATGSAVARERPQAKIDDDDCLQKWRHANMLLRSTLSPFYLKHMQRKKEIRALMEEREAQQQEQQQEVTVREFEMESAESMDQTEETEESGRIDDQTTEVTVLPVDDTTVQPFDDSDMQLAIRNNESTVAVPPSPTTTDDSMTRDQSVQEEDQSHIPPLTESSTNLLPPIEETKRSLPPLAMGNLRSRTGTKSATSVMTATTTATTVTTPSPLIESDDGSRTPLIDEDSMESLGEKDDESSDDVVVTSSSSSFSPLATVPVSPAVSSSSIAPMATMATTTPKAVTTPASKGRIIMLPTSSSSSSTAASTTTTIPAAAAATTPAKAQAPTPNKRSPPAPSRTTQQQQQEGSSASSSQSTGPAGRTSGGASSGKARGGGGGGGVRGVRRKRKQANQPAASTSGGGGGGGGGGSTGTSNKNKRAKR